MIIFLFFWYNKQNPFTTLQGYIDCLVRWSEHWMMAFNVDKCKLMVFNNKILNINLMMTGQEMIKTNNESETEYASFGCGQKSNSKLSCHGQLVYSRNFTLHL